MDQAHTEIPGTNRGVAEGATRVGDANATDKVDLTLTLRGPELPTAPNAAPIDLEEFANKYGAAPADVDAVRRVLTNYGLDVTDVSPAARTVAVHGTVAQVDAAFGVDLGMYRNETQGTFRGRSGSISVPSSLAGIVTGVFGLDERQVARRNETTTTTKKSHVHHRTAPMKPSDLETMYSFPTGDAAGQHVAIAEFGGAYFPTDVEAFSHKVKRPVPTITPYSAGYPLLTMDQIRTLPPDEQQQVLDMSVEVMMDVEIIAALCPAAGISVHFAQFTQKGWIDLLAQVMSSAPVPVALSISWGMPEDSPEWTATALTEINHRLQAASMLGITVCAASGDDGASSQVKDGKAHVNFPASSPYVLAVGGTQLTSAGSEVTWWEAPGERGPGGGGSSTGGVSIVFARPPWQTVHVAPFNHPSIDGRVVPDVAALSGPPMYDLIFMGRDMPNGGTSASAPLWASLLARIAAGLPPAKQRRFVSPLLYAAGPDGRPVGADGCTDIVSGHNSTPSVPQGFQAGVGFDAVTGWGSPIGTTLAALLA